MERPNNKQHASLFNPEYNFNHKVVKQKKNKMKDEQAEEEIRALLKKGWDDDTDEIC